MENKKKGIIALVIMCILSAGLIFGTTYITDWIDNNPIHPSAYKLHDGEYHSEIKGADGSVKYVDMIVKNDAITNVVWDEIDAEGNHKSVLAMEGKYVMTENGPDWAEQSRAMANYVIKHQSVNKLKLSEDGKTNQVASVSIGVNDFVHMIDDCIVQAKA